MVWRLLIGIVYYCLKNGEQFVLREGATVEELEGLAMGVGDKVWRCDARGQCPEDCLARQLSRYLNFNETDPEGGTILGLFRRL